MPTPTVNDLYTLFYGKPVESITPPEKTGDYGIIHFEDGTEQLSPLIVPGTFS